MWLWYVETCKSFNQKMASLLDSISDSTHMEASYISVKMKTDTTITSGGPVCADE